MKCLTRRSGSVLILPESTHSYFVSKGGSDTTGDGSSSNPYLTIQFALDAIGDAADTAEYEADATSRYVVTVLPGRYTEALEIPQRLIIEIRLIAAEIIGDVTYDPDTALGGSSHTPKCIISGTDLRGVHSSGTVPRIGITGDIIYSATTNAISHLILIGIGVSGDIDIGASSTGHQLWTFICNIVGSIDTASGGSVALYLTNANSSGSSSIGGVTGDFDMKSLTNIKFVGPVDTNGETPGGSGRWHHVEFETGHAHDTSGATWSITTDSTSKCSYDVNVPTKGSETFTLEDCAAGMGYTPTTSDDWASIPATILAALDELAEKQKRINFGDGSDLDILYSNSNAQWEDGLGTPLSTVGGKWTVSNPTLILHRDFNFENVTVENVGILQCNGADKSDASWNFQTHKVSGKFLVEAGGECRAALVSGGDAWEGAGKSGTGVGGDASSAIQREFYISAGNGGGGAAGGGDGANNGGNALQFYSAGGGVFKCYDNTYTRAGATGAGVQGFAGIAPIGSLDYYNALMMPGMRGTSGGGGAATNGTQAGDGGSSGAGGGAMTWKCYEIEVESGGSINVNAEIGSDGDDGVSGAGAGQIAAGGGAGGGGGGGTFRLLYQILTNNGTIESAGGLGGTGGAGEENEAPRATSDGGDGGDGSDGFVIIEDLLSI